MFFWTLKWIFISLLLILLIHYLYFFLKNTLTVPKVRDLIHKPQEQYQELLKNSHMAPAQAAFAASQASQAPSSNFKEEGQEEESQLMTEELKKYLEEIKEEI